MSRDTTKRCYRPRQMSWYRTKKETTFFLPPRRKKVSWPKQRVKSTSTVVKRRQAHACAAGLRSARIHPRNNRSSPSLCCRYPSKPVTRSNYGWRGRFPDRDCQMPDPGAFPGTAPQSNPVPWSAIEIHTAPVSFSRVTITTLSQYSSICKRRSTSALQAPEALSRLLSA